MRIQETDKGHLATLPLVKAETPVEEVLNRMKQFRHGAAVIARKDGSYAVVTADEIAGPQAGGAGRKSHGTKIGELVPHADRVLFADVGAMARVAHGMWEAREGQDNYRIIAVGHNAATVLGPSTSHWHELASQSHW